MGLFQALGGHPDQLELSGLADSSQVHHLLEEAKFSNVTCTEYANNLSFEMADLNAMLVGPHGHFVPLLDTLQAAGKADVHQQAPQVNQNQKQYVCSLRHR